jgi:hypothetical protein
MINWTTEHARSRAAQPAAAPREEASIPQN